MLAPFQPKPPAGSPPYLLAHRGISGKAPENTLASFQLALDCDGIDMIELDVRLSKDEQVIVLHDRTLQRTTTGNGPADNYTLKEIKECDAGSWFHPSFAEESVPTLAEVLERVNKKRWVNIEIKASFFFRKKGGQLERRVLDTIYSAGYQHHALVSSFNHDVLSTVRSMDKAIPVGVIYNFPHDFLKSPSNLTRHVGASVFVCAKNELTASMLQDARRHDIAVYVYTLNSPREVERIKDMGVDGILSDNADDIVGRVKKKR